MAIAGVVLLLVAGVLWWLASRWQTQTGLPPARVVYDDASAKRIEPKALVDHAWKLAGRPDYLLEQNGQLIPVEVKPTRHATRPYTSDVMQLASYCRLVEAQYKQRPPHGILRYATQSWEIPYTPELEQQLRETLDLMDSLQPQPTVARSHEEAGRCRACSQRPHCDEALV
jgi:CRISPR-associated exonuclease Cas4